MKERKHTWRGVIFAVASFGVTLAVLGDRPSPAETKATTAAPAAQDVVSLDRRLMAIEQRLYPLESNVRRLEQQVAYLPRPTPSQPTPRDPELERLRSEVELLRARIQELECGLVQVDERTLSATQKTARGRTGRPSNDACRASADTPVRLSTRP